MKKVILIGTALIICTTSLGQGIEEQWNGMMDMESMTAGIIFKIAFIAQVFGLSFFLPRYLIRKAITHENSAISESTVSRYIGLNNMVVAIGFLVLALVSLHTTFTSIVPTLLAIGLYFLLQISPILIYKQLLEYPGIAVNDDQHSFSLTKVIHPLAISVAVFLFLSYLTATLIVWDGSLNKQLLQLAIFIGVNTFLAFVIGKNVRKIKLSRGKEKLKLIAALMRTAPFFVYISIGISLYYFGKMLLFRLELYTYRPFMMSVTLLLLGMLVINQMSYSTSGKERPV